MPDTSLGLELKFGEIDRTWEEFGLKQIRLNFNGRPSDYKAILKNYSLIAIVGKDYKLLPNEVAFDIAENLAKQNGAICHRKILSKSDTHLFAAYLFDKEFDITSAGDTVKVGYVVHNSIDGNIAFGASGFVYRSLCENGIILGYKQLVGLYRRHTRYMEIKYENLHTQLSKVMEATQRAIVRFKEMAREDITEEIVQNLANSTISKKLFPDWLVLGTHRVVESWNPVNSWLGYNDFTQAIWHCDKTTIDTKRVQFQELNKAFRVIESTTRGVRR